MLAGDQVLSDEDLCAFLLEAKRALNRRALVRASPKARDPIARIANNLISPRDNCGWPVGGAPQVTSQAVGIK